jgi:hypothetical protein
MMYRDDRDALQHRLDGTTREAERLRQENEAMRAAVSRIHVDNTSTLMLPPHVVYRLTEVRTLPLEERARLAVHSIRPFPVWATAILNFITLGLFGLIHFGLMHDKLPQAASNDPSAGKAIGFQFIPYYNLYWVFFSALRLCDRLTLQFKLRGLQNTAPRGFLLATCIVSVIPYVNLVIGIPIMWTIAVCLLQSTVNKVARLNPSEWDATIGTGQLAPGPQYPQYPQYPQLPR